VLVADDEAMARRRLVRLLAPMPDVQVVGECADGAAVLGRIQDDDVDLVLLDVQMPGLSGLEALALWPAAGPVVVFCTAHAEHAVAAFDVGAVDYLLKPIEAARLKRALDRARGAEARQRFAAEAERHRRTPPTPELPARLPIETREGIVLVDPADIVCLQIDGALVTVHTRAGELLCDLPLQTLERRLTDFGFLRVHRRALLNLAHVTRLEPIDTGGFVACTSQGLRVEVSRLAARSLRKRLGLRAPRIPSDGTASE
jgi:two-component system LytT family response regulator